MGTRRVDPQPPPETASTLARLEVETLGARGEGEAVHDGRRVRVPYALAGETVTADVAGERATLVGVVAPSPDRITPICPHFSICGGCAVQTLATPVYAAWKRGLLVGALARAGVTATVGPLVDAHGAGRRRATFHARTDAGGTRVGFMRVRSHEIATIDACPILDPGLAGALDAARAIAAALAAHSPPLRGGGSSLDILCTATDCGLDIDLRGHGPLDDDARAGLVAIALARDLARLSNHGTIVVERRKPVLRIGKAGLALPPGAFLQATGAGEQALAERVVDALAGASRIADLFAGIGTFALRLAERAEVAAYDTDVPALTALVRAARETPSLRPVAAEPRDLFRRPLSTQELARFDALVIDPPRAGAEAQMRSIAASPVTRVVSVACDVASFARDAAVLSEAGFVTERIDPIDQFKYSPHLEMLAVFNRRSVKPRRRLLG